MVVKVRVSNVEELYKAVYAVDETPRDDVEIILAPGEYVLDPSKPFGGRLILGRRTVLRSTLTMALNERDTPELNEVSQPILITEGARLDGSRLMDEPFGEGIIIVGEGGVAEGLWVDGGNCPGIEITSQGTVRQVYSSNHSLGFRVRAAADRAHGIVEECLLMNNSYLGISIIGLEPSLRQTIGGKVKVRAELRRNTVANNHRVNINIVGGIGSDQDEVVVYGVGNDCLGISNTNIRVVGGLDFYSPGGNNNQVEFTWSNNVISNGEIGTLIEAARLNGLETTKPLKVRQSNSNSVEAEVTDTIFENNLRDIAVYGARSFTSEPAGNENRAKIIVRNENRTSLTHESWDCDPLESFSNCTNKASIEFLGGSR